MVPVNSFIQSHVTIAKRYTEMAQEKRDALVNTLKTFLKGGTVAMTTDMWTEDYRKICYLTITCHFISEDMELVNTMLTIAMISLEEGKMGENIRREILKLLVTNFGLDACSLSKIVWVTDEGANIKLALRPYQRLDCIEHVINTVYGTPPRTQHCRVIQSRRCSGHCRYHLHNCQQHCCKWETLSSARYTSH